MNEIEPRTAGTDAMVGYLGCGMCLIIAVVCPCLIVIAIRTDYLQRLIFCQMALNNNATDGNLAGTDNIKCDFDTRTIKGFDDWYLPKLGN